MLTGYTLAHMRLLARKYEASPKMIDPTTNETAAAIQGGKCGAEYLESIGQTDLVRLTREQWQTFCLSMAGGYTDALAELGDDIPF